MWEGERKRKKGTDNSVISGSTLLMIILNPFICSSNSFPFSFLPVFPPSWNRQILFASFPSLSLFHSFSPSQVSLSSTVHMTILLLVKSRFWRSFFSLGHGDVHLSGSSSHWLLGWMVNPAVSQERMKSKLFHYLTKSIWDPLSLFSSFFCNLHETK